MNSSLFWKVRNSAWFPVILAVLSGFILWLSWPPFNWTYLIFIGFTPVLLMEQEMVKRYKKPGKRVFWFAFLAFFIWNLLTTYWIYFASPEGAGLAIILNSVLMAFPFYFFHKVKKRMGLPWAYVALISMWMLLEMLHLNWQAPWPWLNLGNVWAGMPAWVQWYEYTGTLGGTLWVWAMNCLIFSTVSFVAKAGTGDQTQAGKLAFNINRKRGIIALFTLLIPVVVSYAIRPADKPGDPSQNIVVVQPNIDPFNDKFDTNSFDYQVNTLLKLSKDAVDEHTVMLAWPETSIPYYTNEKDIENSPYIHDIKEFINKHPKIVLIAGTVSQYPYGRKKPASLTVRSIINKAIKDTFYYDEYNTALRLDSSRHYEVYHKSKLVPGVEIIPYPEIFGFFEKLTISLGGASGSYGHQDTPSVFRINKQYTTAPIICYESIFGDHVSRFIRKKANIITIITNDGWWKKTDGLQQHVRYAILRAIETRKMIARSANTGISCFISPSGRILQEADSWVPAVLKQNISTDDGETFYVKYGDYLGYLAMIPGFLAIFLALFGRFIKR